MHPFGVNGLWLYVAISNPLLYSLIMSRMACIEMAVGAFTAGLLNSTVNTSYVSSLPFCSSNVIHHFFCDNTPTHTLFKLSFLTHACMKASFPRLLVNMVGTLLVTLTFYSYMLSHEVVIRRNHLWSMWFISVNKYSCRHEVSSYFLLLINSTQEQMWNKS